MAPPTSGTNAGFAPVIEQALGGEPAILDSGGHINVTGATIGLLHVDSGAVISGGDTILGGAVVSGGLSLPGLATVSGGASGSLYTSGGAILINP